MLSGDVRRAPNHGVALSLKRKATLANRKPEEKQIWRLSVSHTFIEFWVAARYK